MRVFVTGATGVLGGSAVRALLADGHELTGLARTPEKAAALTALGVAPLAVGLFDVAALTSAIRGFDAVCNLATRIPVGSAAMRPGAWRANDRLRADGSRAVADACRSAGVGRLVQESNSYVYADGGDDWLTERSPLSVTRALEPTVVAETNALRFGDGNGESVVLRFGRLLGSGSATRWLLSRARAGRPIGVGAPDGWAHVIHPDDAGAAVAAALRIPPGVYNAGAEPMRRADILRVVGEAVSRRVRFVPGLVVRLAGERLEPLTRSHRVSSERLTLASGLLPKHPVFDVEWVADGAR